MENKVENRIVVIVPFYNCANYILECYESLIHQKYSNFLLIFSDDFSTDSGIDLIPDDPSIIRISHQRRLYAIENIARALENRCLDDDDIVAIVDGDDYLLHDQVFKKLNALYSENEYLVTYGQYCLGNGILGHCAPYTPEEFKNLRTLNWRASHLKTFRYNVYKRFLQQDPDLRSFKDETGRFYTMTYDVALMYPLMEMAGYDKVYFNKEVLYVYRQHEQNDMHINRNLQLEYEQHIRSKPAFAKMF